MGENEDENIQNSGTVMHFLVQNLKIKKNGEQLKHRNIMNEILWIYGMSDVGRFSTYIARGQRSSCWSCQQFLIIALKTAGK